MRNVRADCAAAGAISVGLGVISVGVRTGASRSGGAALDEGGLLGWEIYLWVLAGTESLLVWGILAGWMEGKVFLVARLKRSTIDWCGFFAIFYFFGGGL